MPDNHDLALSCPPADSRTPGEGDAPHPLARFISVATIPLVGLVAFGVLVKSGAGAGASRPQLLGVDEEAALFVAASATLVGIGLALRRGVVMAAINQVVIPVAATVLLVLQSFPAGGVVNSLWPPVAVFVTAFAAQFAVAVVFSLVGSGELSVFAAVLPSLVAYACARIVGMALDMGLAGVANPYSVYPVVLTVLLGGMLLGVILQMRRSLFGRGEGVAGGGSEASTSMAMAAGLAAEDLAGRYGLTPRETEVLRLLLRGQSSPAIAAELVISDNTVRTHMKNIYRKLDVNSRDGLMALVS